MNKIQHDYQLEEMINNLLPKNIIPEKVRSVAIEEAKNQRNKAAKEIVVNRLKEVIKLIEDDDIKRLKKHVKYSPAGDYMGSENHYINFCKKIEDIGDYIRFFDNSY